MKTIIVHHRSPHHAVNSGYGRLADYIPEINLVSGNAKFPYKLAKYFSGKMDQNVGRYDSASIMKELELYKLLRQHKKEDKVIHYLNAERDIRHLVKWKRFFKSAFFCGTFHKPPDILKKHIKTTKYLKNLDGAIAVGINQVAFLKDWLHMDAVQYIPHGVDTQFFHPSADEKQEKRILFVGQYMRDFDTLNAVAKIILAKRGDLKIDVVLRKEFIKFVNDHPSITTHSGISDFHLRQLYQNSTLLFEPLLNSTACNSILEAMACGLPVITSNVGGTSEYLDGTENICVDPEDNATFTETILNLLDNTEKLENMGISSRNKAMRYDWTDISKQVALFYKKISKE